MVVVLLEHTQPARRIAPAIAPTVYVRCKQGAHPLAGGRSLQMLRQKVVLLCPLEGALSAGAEEGSLRIPPSRQKMLQRLGGPILTCSAVVDGFTPSWILLPDLLTLRMQDFQM